MKKLFSLVLVSALLLSACGSTATPQTPATTPPATNNPSVTNAPVVETPAVEEPEDELSGNLLVWLDSEPWAEALIKAFTAKHPKVTIEWELGGLGSATDLALAGPAGTGADVISMPHNGLSEAFADGVLEPFPAALQATYEEMLIEPAMKTGKVDGTLYGAPIGWENIGLFYNKDLIATPPQTFDEIFEFAKTYNDPSAGKYAMQWVANDAFHNYFALTAFGYSLFGPNMEDYKQLGFDLPSVTEGLKFHTSLREIFPLNSSDISWENTVAAFGRGEVPLCITGTWAIAGLKENNINFGVTKIPTINGVQPRVFAAGTLVGVSSYSENKEAAFAFADFMVSEEGAAIFYAEKASLPTLKDLSGIPGLADDEPLMGLAEQSPYADAMSSIPETGTVLWVPFNELFTFAWDGQLTVEETQAKSTESFEMLLNATGKSLYD